MSESSHSGTAYNGTAARDPSLPDYRRPPVVEVSLSIQFESIPMLRTAQLWLLWTEFKTKFPKTEEHAPLEPTLESFESPVVPPKVGIRLEVYDAPPVPRVWFVNQNETELIQVQQTRFIHNWRKIADETPYPRYESIRQDFQKELEQFRVFLSREKLGELRPNQCEVTYVNHLSSGEGWQAHGELDEIFTVWDKRYSDRFLSQAEDITFAIRYRIPDPAGNPIGRLHVVAQPGFRKTDTRPMLILSLTARGAPQGEGIEAAFKFLDTGREWIVRGFTSITTPKMQEIWGRCDAEYLARVR